MKLGYRAEPPAARRLVRDDAVRRASPTRSSRCGSSSSPTGSQRRPDRRCVVAVVGLGALGRRHLVHPGARSTGCSGASATRSSVALESHVARLQAAVATIEHHERPEYLDRLSVLRDQVFALDHLFMSLFSTVGLDHPPRRSPGPADVRPRRPVFLVVLAVPIRAHGHVAARRSSGGRGGGRRARPPRPPPLRARHHRSARQGDPGRRHRRQPRHRAPGGRGTSGTARSHHVRWATALLARARVGGVRPRLRRRHRLRRRPARPVRGRRRPARRRRRQPAVAVRRRGGRRARVPARVLARLGPPAGLAGGLRRRDRRGRRPRTARPVDRRHPVRARVVPLSRHRPRSCSTTWTCTSRPARSSRSSARTARARPRS